MRRTEAGGREEERTWSGCNNQPGGILSEVSPPTALSCFAAAALTGGNPYWTTLYAWKYTLPAFIVPFMFTLDAKGVGILLKGPAPDVVWTIVPSFIGLTALAAGVENRLLRRTTLYEGLMLIAGGLVLVYPIPVYDTIGFILLGLVFFSQKIRKPSSARSWHRPRCSPDPPDK